MTNRVVIVDTGLGNLGSVARAIDHLGGTAAITTDPDEVRAAGRLVLPGVGAFGTAMVNLRKKHLDEAIRDMAASGRPLLGVCLGMQLLMEGSDEGGTHEGLGILPGRVTRLPQAPGFKVPHIGWSPLEPDARSWRQTALDGIRTNDALYFVHSYYVVPAHEEDALAYTDYGDCRYCSVISHGNIVGCQAHPEKSGPVGLAILRNFLSLESH